MIYPGEGKKGQPKAGDYVLAAEQTRAEAAASPHRSTAVDLARADKWEGQARTKQLPSTRTEIGAGGELIDVENRWDALGVVNTVADPDYVTAGFRESRTRARLEALLKANAAPRCGARSKRTGKPCQGAAMPNGRCKLQLDEDTAAAISTVSQSSTGALRIKMHNKLAALVVLGKYLGLFDERPQNSNVIYAISDEPMSAGEWKKQFVKAG
jgi:hypothetical protein